MSSWQQSMSGTYTLLSECGMSEMTSLAGFTDDSLQRRESGIHYGTRTHATQYTGSTGPTLQSDSYWMSRCCSRNRTSKSEGRNGRGIMVPAWCFALASVRRIVRVQWPLGAGCQRHIMLGYCFNAVSLGEALYPHLLYFTQVKIMAEMACAMNFKGQNGCGLYARSWNDTRMNMSSDQGENVKSDDNSWIRISTWPFTRLFLSPVGLPSKHETFIQCWGNVCPTYSTLAQHPPTLDQYILLAR